MSLPGLWLSIQSSHLTPKQKELWGLLRDTATLCYPSAGSTVMDTGQPAFHNHPVHKGPGNE